MCKAENIDTETSNFKETIIQLERLKEQCFAVQEIDDCLNYSDYIKALDTAIGILKDLNAESKTKCEEMIFNILREIGVPQRLKGYDYIADAILCMIAFPDKKITDIYAELAVKYDTTPPVVERAIRYCVERTFDNIRSESIERIFTDLDCNRSEPANNEFLASIANYLRFCEFV